MKSKIDFPRMREIFFAHDTFSLSGKGNFNGTFHLFSETMPGGRIRTGRELKGTFKSHAAGVNTLRFGDLRGSVLWVPEYVEVTDATAAFYGGAARFGYRMAPLGAARRDRDLHVRRRVSRRRSDRVHRLPRAAGACAWPAARRGATCSSGRAAASPTARGEGEIRVDTARRAPSC